MSRTVLTCGCILIEGERLGEAIMDATHVCATHGAGLLIADRHYVSPLVGADWTVNAYDVVQVHLTVVSHFEI